MKPQSFTEGFSVFSKKYHVVGITGELHDAYKHSTGYWY